MPRYVNLDEEARPIRGYKFSDYSGDQYTVEMLNGSGDLMVYNDDTGFQLEIKSQDARKLSEALRRMADEVDKRFEDDDEF